MLRFSAKEPSFAEKTRFLLVLCTLFLYEPSSYLSFNLYSTNQNRFGVRLVFFVQNVEQNNP